MAVLTELKNRGVADVFFLVCDGSKGLPYSVAAVWPATIVQTCIIHLIRGSIRYASRKYWEQLAADLKPIYQAVNAEAAAAALNELHTKWGARYPAIIRLWRSAWAAPQLAVFGEAARHVPQLQVQILRGASQKVEGVLRGDLEPLHQDSFGLADDISGQQCLLQTAAKALKGAAFIDRPGRHRGVRGQNESNFLRGVVEGIRSDAVGVQGSAA